MIKKHEDIRPIFLKNYALLFCSLLCCAVVGHAQQKRIDSLHRVLQNPAHDTVRLSAWTTLANTYRNNKPDSAIYYAKRVLDYGDGAAIHKYKALSANALGYGNYFKGDYPNAISAFKTYYRYAEKNNDRLNMAYAINNEGNVYIELGNYGQALENYKKALRLREDAKDEYGVAMSNNNIGFVYKDIGDYENAVSHFLFALRQYEKLARQPDIAITYNFLGSVFYKKKDFANAIIYHGKALQIQKASGDRNGTGISLQSLANAYGEQKDFVKALQHFTMAETLYAEAKDRRQLSLVKSSIGELYVRQENYAAALPYLTESIALSQQIGNRRSLAELWLRTAGALLKINQLATARPLIDSAALLTQQTGNKDHLKLLYETQAAYYEATGDATNALVFARKHSAQKDVLLNEANIKSLNDLQVQYETEKKQQAIALLNKDNDIKALRIKNQQLTLDEQLYEISRSKLALSQADLQIVNNQLRLEGQKQTILKQQLDSSERARDIDNLQKQTLIQGLEIQNRQLAINRRNVLLASLLGATVLLALLGFSYYRRKRLQQQATLQAAILYQQEQSTKAVLAAEETERQRIAKDLHDGVGQMMSAAKMNLSAFEYSAKFSSEEERLGFEKIIQLVDESCTEVRAVSHNMMPNALLKNSLAAAIREFISKLDNRQLAAHLYTEGLDERLDADIETVLYRVVQECVNNVIKHSGASQLDISIAKEEKAIAVTIEDNGKGFDVADKQKTGGLGLKNIRTRIDYLKGTVDIDSAPDRGTLVALHVPLGEPMKK